ncbi:DUF167 domain-containing protein [Pararhodobacter sp.]|uniref:DUF167 domain-containing protein n=1 Tax=Pararhodobacter sp. TaxID=2127056 RepID=UPI002AFDF8A2|nr:DUF167 domain-containing protein [Pararhodobacter sp.]
MTLPDLSGLAVDGATFAVRATPKARRNAIQTGDPIRVWVTDPPDNGKANDAIRKLLAKALGVAPTRLTLKRGATSRDKLFQLD